MGAQCCKANDGVVTDTGKEEEPRRNVGPVVITNEDRRIVFLGCGSVGKSTLWKHFQYNYGDASRQIELCNENAIDNLWHAVDPLTNTAVVSTETGMIAKARLKVAFVKLKASSAYMYNKITPSDIDAIGEFWNDPGTKRCYEDNRNNLIESAKYFLDNVDRVGALGAAFGDWLWVRIRTTGIVQSDYSINGYGVRIADTGGERNERRKWIHMFNDISAYVYVVDIASYDMNLFEDDTRNRLIEAIELWQELQIAKKIEKAVFYLVFNKKDVFAAKIAKTDLKVCFPEYNGGNNYEAALDYIKSKFDTSRVRKSFVTNMMDVRDTKAVIETMVEDFKQWTESQESS